MIEFEEAPKFYLSDKRKAEHEKLEDEQHYQHQIIQNHVSSFINKPKTIKKSLTNKPNHSFCSNTFKEFLNSAKKIDDKRQNVLNQS